MMRNADQQSEGKATLSMLLHKKIELEEEYSRLPKKSSFSGLAILDELNQIEEEIESFLFP